MSLNLTDATAELNTIPMRAESLPMLQQLANGANPNIPGFLALAKMQELTNLLGHSQQAQPPQGTVKDRIEQTANTLATQGQRMQQMQHDQMQQGLGAFGPAPQNVPQPVAQPEPEPVAMADGGILSSQIDPRLFSFAPGGIVAFSGKDESDVKDKEKRKREEEMRLAQEIVERNNPRGNAGIQYEPYVIGGRQTPRVEENERLPQGNAGITYAPNTGIGNVMPTRYVPKEGSEERETEMMRAVKTPFRAIGAGLASLYGGNAGTPSNTDYTASGDLAGAIMGERNQPKTGIEAEIAAGIRSLEQQTGRTLSPGARQVFAQRYIAEHTGQVPNGQTAATNNATPVAGPAPAATVGGPAGPVAGPRPTPPGAPSAGPVVGGGTNAAPVAGPAAPALPGVPAGAVGTGATGIMNLANQLTPKVEDFNQEKAIQDQQKLNEALGIGTYGKNRREQLAKMKEEFESNRPSEREQWSGLLQAFAKPGARAGAIGETGAAQMKTEREARQKFAEAQDVLTDAIEKADEAVRSGNATEILKTKAAVEAAKRDMQKLGVQSAVHIAQSEIAANANITSARIHAAATKAGITKPSEAERVRAAAEKVFADAEAAKKGSGPAAVDKFLEDEARIRAAVGGTRYTGQNKDIEHEKMIQERVEKRTAVIDQQLQNPKLKPEKRAKLEETRAQIERDVRKGFPTSGTSAAPSSSGNMPQAGQVIDGYKFNGGNPADKNNWTKV